MTIFTAWREITGLTAQQIATLQDSETSRMTAHPSSPCRVDATANLLRLAESYAATNALQITYADVPAPEGAVIVDEWEDDRDDLGPLRTFTGSSWQVPVAEGDPWIVLTAATITVEISGLQRADGTVQRWVVTTFPEGGCESRYDLPATTARVLAESLSAAVAEAERMNAADGGTLSSYPLFSAVER